MGCNPAKPFHFVIAGQARYLYADIRVIEAFFDGFLEVVGVLLVFVIEHAGVDAGIGLGDDHQVVGALPGGLRWQAHAKPDHDRKTVDLCFTNRPQVAWENTAH